MKKIAVILSLLMILGSVPSWAMTCPLGNWADEKAKSDSYGTRWAGVFVGGLDRLIMAPVELVYHPYDQIAKQKNYKTGLFVGLGEGLVGAVKDIGIGVVNIVGSPVPDFHGLAAGESSTSTKTA